MTEFYRDNQSGEFEVKKGIQRWRAFDYGVTLKIHLDVRAELEKLLRIKGYENGDHEALGMILSEALRFVSPKIESGALVLSIQPGMEHERAKHVDFTIDKTDYKALASVYEAFPMLKREFVINEIFRISLNQIGDRIDENERNEQIGGNR